MFNGVFVNWEKRVENSVVYSIDDMWLIERTLVKRSFGTWVENYVNNSSLWAIGGIPCPPSVNAMSCFSFYKAEKFLVDKPA